jgi:hypothetical protein
MTVRQNDSGESSVDGVSRKEDILDNDSGENVEPVSGRVAKNGRGVASSATSKKAGENAAEELSRKGKQQGDDVIEGDDGNDRVEEEGREVEEDATEADTSHGQAAGIQQSVQARTAGGAEGESAKDAVKAKVESETAVKSLTAQGDGGGSDVDVKNGTDEHATQGVDSASPDPASPAVHAGSSDPASSETDLDTRDISIPKADSKAQEAVQSGKATEVHEGQSQQTSGDDTQVQSDSAAGQRSQHSSPGTTTVANNAETNDGAHAQAGVTAVVPPANVHLSGDGVDIAPSGEPEDDGHDASRDGLTSESEVTVYELAVDDTENGEAEDRQNGHVDNGEPTARGIKDDDGTVGGQDKKLSTTP